MQLKTRVLIIILASLLGLITMGAFGLHAMRQSMYEERRSQISQLLDFSETLLKHYHAQEVSGKITREEAQARAKEAIGAQRQGKNNYFFIRTLQQLGQGQLDMFDNALYLCQTLFPCFLKKRLEGALMQPF